MPKLVGKRNFFELKLQFSFKKDSELPKLKFNYGPSCKGVPYLRKLTVGLFELTLIAFTLAKQLTFRMYGFWASGKKKEIEGWQGIVYPRIGKAEGRDVQVRFKWRVRSVPLVKDLGISLESVRQTTRCSDNSIPLSIKGYKALEKQETSFSTLACNGGKLASTCRLKVFC